MAYRAPQVTQGEVDFEVPGTGKQCKTWYQIVGDVLTSRRPLVLVHGGPGMGHDYLTPLWKLNHLYNIPVVFYDQLGCGRSTHLPEKIGDENFWTTDLFMNELENLLFKLGINHDYDLLGQSWGGMLCAMFAVRQPWGLHKVIISNSPASMAKFSVSCNKLRKMLPKPIEETLRKHEDEGTTDHQDYEAACNIFYERHFCRMTPFPEEVQKALNCVKEDPTVYHTMNGPSEFHVTGSLKNWTLVEESKMISVPTFLINGRFDEAQDLVVEPFFQNIPRVRWVTMENSSHLPMIEETDRYLQLVGDFLSS